MEKYNIEKKYNKNMKYNQWKKFLYIDLNEFEKEWEGIESL